MGTFRAAPRTGTLHVEMATNTAPEFRVLIPVLGFGRTGGFRVLAKLADEWARGGMRTAFLAPCWSDRPHFPTTAEIHWVNEWGRSTGHVGPSCRSALGGVGSFLAIMLGVARTGPWDAIVANHSLTTWPIALAPTSAEKLYYVQAYEPEYYAGKPGPSNRFRQGLSWASYILPLRKIVNAPLYLRYGACRSDTWIPPGIDLELFFPKAQASDEPGGARPLTVGCIGRAEPEKGTAQALEAYRRFAERAGSFARLRIADFGVLPDLLRDLPGVERVVPTNDSELSDYYRSLDVLLALGTLQHGAHHYPVMEAMACGVPVVTTGYMPADEGNAWIVDATPSAAAEALDAIWKDPRAAARKREDALRAIERYAWPAVGRAFADAIRLSRPAIP
jgi:glycosyltransferase involved in cell wall biosynthesis